MTRVHRAALKHGVDEAAILAALTSVVFVAALGDEVPTRELLLAFDDRGRLLELVFLRFDIGEPLVIHAMKARPGYLDLLP